MSELKNSENISQGLEFEIGNLGKRNKDLDSINGRLKEEMVKMQIGIRKGMLENDGL